MKLLVHIIISAALAMGAVAEPCPPQGNSKNKRIQAIDLLKNRTKAPTSINPAITLEAILAPGDDTMRFSPNDGAMVRGYVALVKPGGPETCHCGAKGQANEDTHIVLVSDPKYAKDNKRHFIVEITPQSRKAFGLPDTATIRKQFVGKWVTVTGYIFFDEEHKQNAVNTNPKGKDLWRATCVEIHPVVKIQSSR